MRKLEVFRRGHALRSVAWLPLFLAASLYAPRMGAGQSAGVNQGGPDYIHAPAGTDPVRQQGSTQALSKVDQMRQAERRRRMVADAAKLVELSNQLKAQIDQAPTDQLSLEVVRKAAEIEKTAHDVREWSKS